MSIAEQPQAAEATDRQTVRVMLDLETLGTTPGSVILSIGAVKFGGGEILDEFYGMVEPKSCVAIGMTIDIGTVQWWMEQHELVRFAAFNGWRSLDDVLHEFSQWIGCDDAEMWGNGAAFDNVCLAEAYRLAGIAQPWSFRGDRCYRTIKNLHPEIEFEPFGTAHNALDDAIAQAKHLMRILPNL